MTTVDASFDDYEERWARYWAHGRTSSKPLPGMVLPATAAAFTVVHLLKSDCRSSLIYPNTFDSLSASFVPQGNEYGGYAGVGVNRDATGWAVAAASGGYQISNVADLLFPAASGATTGCTLTHAIFTILYWSGFGPSYGIFVTQLSSNIVVAVGTQPRLTAGGLTFRVK